MTHKFIDKLYLDKDGTTTYLINKDLQSCLGSRLVYSTNSLIESLEHIPCVFRCNPFLLCGIVWCSARSITWTCWKIENWEMRKPQLMSRTQQMKRNKSRQMQKRAKFLKGLKIIQWDQIKNDEKSRIIDQNWNDEMTAIIRAHNFIRMCVNFSLLLY